MYKDHKGPHIASFIQLPAITSSTKLTMPCHRRVIMTSPPLRHIRNLSRWPSFSTPRPTHTMILPSVIVDPYDYRVSDVGGTQVLFTIRQLDTQA